MDDVRRGLLGKDHLESPNYHAITRNETRMIGRGIMKFDDGEFYVQCGAIITVSLHATVHNTIQFKKVYAQTLRAQYAAMFFRHLNHQ